MHSEMLLIEFHYLMHIYDYKVALGIQTSHLCQYSTCVKVGESNLKQVLIRTIQFKDLLSKIRQEHIVKTCRFWNLTLINLIDDCNSLIN